MDPHVTTDAVEKHNTKDAVAAGKFAAQKQWNANACGTGEHLAGIEPESLEFNDDNRPRTQNI